MTSGPGPLGAGDELRDVPGWRRIGLVLSWSAVGCAAAALMLWLTEDRGPSTAMASLLAAAVLAGLLGPVFLRRAWSVPGIAADPVAVRARRWSEVAAVSWGASVVLHAVVDVLLDRGGAWLDGAQLLLSTALVVAYGGMLVLATRWRPRPGDAVGQL
jgi:hypothetical protein